MPVMEMQRDNVTGGIITVESQDCGRTITHTIKNCTLARLQHQLSLYRKRA
jgi:hypothetical protein